MLIVAQHDVHDPGFWPVAASAQLPDTFRLLQVVPSADGKHGVCLWDAPSVEALRDFVQTGVGHLSHNDFFAIDEAHAVGIPTREAGEATHD